MVPVSLWVSSACSFTSTSGTGDLGGTSFVRPASALVGREGGHWRLRGRKWWALLSRQACPMLRVYPTWNSVGHAPFVFVSGPVFGPVSVAVDSR